MFGGLKSKYVISHQRPFILYDEKHNGGNRYKYADIYTACNNCPLYNVQVERRHQGGTPLNHPQEFSVSYEEVAIHPNYLDIGLCFQRTGSGLLILLKWRQSLSAGAMINGRGNSA